MKCHKLINICWYCGGYGTSKDHVTPRSKGGSNKKENIVIACTSCNSSKGSLLLEEFRNVKELRKAIKDFKMDSEKWTPKQMMLLKEKGFIKTKRHKFYGETKTNNLTNT